jgi:hypothetical protein
VQSIQKQARSENREKKLANFDNFLTAALMREQLFLKSQGQNFLRKSFVIFLTSGFGMRAESHRKIFGF